MLATRWARRPGAALPGFGAPAGPPCSSAWLFLPAGSVSMRALVRLSNYTSTPRSTLTPKGWQFLPPTGASCCQSCMSWLLEMQHLLAASAFHSPPGWGSHHMLSCVSRSPAFPKAVPGLPRKTSRAMRWLISVSSANLPCDASMYFSQKNTLWEGTRSNSCPKQTHV